MLKRLALIALIAIGLPTCAFAQLLQGKQLAPTAVQTSLGSPTGYPYFNGSSAPGFSTTIPFSNLSSSATCAQLPAFTGAVTTTAGACATTLAAGAALANLGSVFSLSTSGNYATTGGTAFSGKGVVDLANYAPTCNGTADDTAKFSSALAFVDALGGGEIDLIPGKICTLSTTLAISQSSIGLKCPGYISATHNISTPPTSGCWIKWIGASAGTMVTIIAPSGASTDGFLTGNFVRGINFDGNSGLAADAVHVESVRNGVFDLYGQNFNGGNIIDLDVVHVASTSTFGDPCDSQYNLVNVSGNQFSGTSNVLRLGGWNNASIPNTGCDASLNTIAVSAGIYNGNAVVHYGDDNNVETTVTAYLAGGGTGYAEIFDVDTTGSMLTGANSDIVQHLSTNAPSIVRGQTTYSGCVVGTTCPHGITLNLDAGNGTPVPTLETGIRPYLDVFWTTTTNGGPNPPSWTPVFSCIAGTLGAAPSIQTANYTKVGRNLSYNLKFTMGAIGTCSGGLYATLPTPAVAQAPAGSVAGDDTAQGPISGWVDGTLSNIRMLPNFTFWASADVSIVSGTYVTAN